MKGSTKAGINPVKLGGAGKGTSKANTGFRMPGAKTATKAPNQNLKTKITRYHQTRGQGLV